MRRSRGNQDGALEEEEQGDRGRGARGGGGEGAGGAGIRNGGRDGVKRGECTI